MEIAGREASTQDGKAFAVTGGVIKQFLVFLSGMFVRLLLLCDFGLAEAEGTMSLRELNASASGRRGGTDEDTTLLSLVFRASEFRGCSALRVEASAVTHLGERQESPSTENRFLKMERNGL